MSSAPDVTLVPGTKRRLLDASPAAGEPWYINDHTLVQDHDGTWHVFGIWHPEPAAPLDETFFLHASAPASSPATPGSEAPAGPAGSAGTARTPGAAGMPGGASTSSGAGMPGGAGPPSLAELACAPARIGSEGSRWVLHEPVLRARVEHGETHVWAPHVIEYDGHWWMVYCGGTPDHSAYRIELATSSDLFTWEHHDRPLFQDGFDARDPMLLCADGRWLLYYTRTSTPRGGHHEVAVRESRDLLHWSAPAVALRSHRSGTVGGPTESPFVIRIPRVQSDVYVLFVCESGRYDRTLAYSSPDPTRFSEDAELDVDLDEHCAEIVADGRRMWITGGGWGRGGLTIRDLRIS